MLGGLVEFPQVVVATHVPREAEEMSRPSARQGSVHVCVRACGWAEGPEDPAVRLQSMELTGQRVEEGRGMALHMGCTGVVSVPGLMTRCLRKQMVPQLGTASGKDSGSPSRELRGC